MKERYKQFAVLVVVGALAGCAQTAPIERLHSAVTAGYSAERVKSAILKAGEKHEWVMTEAGSGIIKGLLQARGHFVEVRIVYSATDYSIIYQNSTNMKATASKIHKNYNRWVHNLDHDIQRNLLKRAYSA